MKIPGVLYLYGKYQNLILVRNIVFPSEGKEEVNRYFAGAIKLHKKHKMTIFTFIVNYVLEYFAILLDDNVNAVTTVMF